MTQRPKLRLGSSLAPGILAVGLFGLMALIVLNTPFEAEAMTEGGFAVDSVTASIGYALFDLVPLQEAEGVADTEPFLAAFFLIALTLDAALDASLVLAKREEDGQPVAALASRGSADEAGAGTSTVAESRSTATDGGTPDGDRAAADTGTNDAADADGGGA